jgi:hypothetical protein
MRLRHTFGHSPPLRNQFSKTGGVYESRTYLILTNEDFCPHEILMHVNLLSGFQEVRSAFPEEFQLHITTLLPPPRHQRRRRSRDTPPLLREQVVRRARVALPKIKLEISGASESYGGEYGEFEGRNENTPYS